MNANANAVAGANVDENANTNVNGMLHTAHMESKHKTSLAS